MKKIAFFVLIIFLMEGCKKEPSEIIFYGELKKINLNQIPKIKLTSAQIQLEDIQTGRVYVHDSLAIYVSSQFPKYNIHVYNLKRDSLIGRFVMKGLGPNEMDYIVNPIRFFEIDEELYAWLYHVNGKKMYRFNISKSIETGLTVFDNSIGILWGEAPFNYVNVMEDDKLLIKETSEANIDMVSSISYKILEKDSTKYQKKYEIFGLKKLPKDQSWVFMDHRIFYGSTDAIKPDATKVAMAMYNFPQVNILDLKSGQLKGIQVEDVVWNYINIKPREAISYYRALVTSNEYVYALYLNKPLDYMDENQTIDTSTNIVHIFDWDGNLQTVIELDQSVNSLAIDIKVTTQHPSTSSKLFIYNTFSSKHLGDFLCISLIISIFAI